MSSDVTQRDELDRPHLWNPNAAANWSLLFTPAFGAYLHASNWRTLGKPERVSASMRWFWITVVYLTIFVPSTLFLPASRAIDTVVRWVGMGLLFGWYFTQGKKQSGYIRDSLDNTYIRKGWVRPVLIGIALMVAYYAAIGAVSYAVHAPPASERAAACAGREMRRSIA